MDVHVNPRDFLIRARAFAAERAASLPVPEPKYGLGIFFTSKDVGIGTMPVRAEASELVITTAASSEDVTVLPFAEAVAHPELAPLVRARLHPSMLADAFDAWRAAHAEGTVIHVPDGATADISIVLPEGAAVADHLMIAVGEGATVTVTEETAPGADGAVRVGQTDLVLLDGADVRFIALTDGDDARRDVARRFASVGKDARMTWVSAVTGGRYVQQHVRTALVDEGASVVHRDAFCMDGASRADLRQVVVHAASRTSSDLVTRGTAAGTSKTVTRGVIAMEKGMTALKGSQRADLRMLSPKAEIDAMPDLEIDTADVVCGHAATISTPDEAKLFYLRSRGISRDDALRMQIDGLFAPIVSSASEGMRDRIAAALAARIDSSLTNA